MEEATYQALVTDAKLVAVRQLRKRIKFGTAKSISAREITEALKLLNEIDSRTYFDEDGDTSLQTTEEYAKLLVLSYKKKTSKLITNGKN